MMWRPGLKRGGLSVQDNSLSEYWFALSKESPAKTWWDAAYLHPAIYRALRIARGDTGAIYAIHPFRLARIEDRAVVLAAHPAPRILDDPEHEWLSIETVIAWEPITNKAHVLGDPVPQLVGTLTDDANELHADPRAFFQSWARRRAIFAVQRQQARKDRWHISPSERDEAPGALIVGQVKDIRWNPSAMPAHIECVGCDAREINRAILRAARLPFATGSVTSGSGSITRIAA